MTDRKIERLLVTGCCGFIGANFVNHIMSVDPDIQVVNLDMMDYCANEKNILEEHRRSGRYTLARGSTCNAELVTFLFSTYRFDAVINFAANSHVDHSFGSSMDFTTNNVLGTHVLLEAAQAYHAATKALKVLVHISTDEVYGEVCDDVARVESSILEPTNPYAATKAAAEFLARAYYTSHGLPVIVTRGNNVYGPYQYPEKVIPRFVWLLLHGEKMTLHGKGETRRAFMHVADVARAITVVMKRGHPGAIYNVGTDDEHTVQDVAERIAAIMKPGEPLERYVRRVEDRKYNDFRYHIDTKRLEDLGWRKEIDFDTGLPATVKWYVEEAFPKRHWESPVPL